MRKPRSKRIKPHIPRLAWSLEEVAKALGLSLGFMRKEAWKGAILTTQMGRRTMVTDAELHRYLHEGSRKTELSELEKERITLEETMSDLKKLDEH